MHISRAERLASKEITDIALIHDPSRQLLTEQTIKSAPNLLTEQIVEAALLSDSSIDECVVLKRETATSEQELVAYVVSSRPFDPQRLQSHLQAGKPCPTLPLAYVPVSTLPLTPTGEVDKLALARIEVLDSDLVQRWSERLQDLPSVEQVAVVVQEYTESIPPLHLEDLLPEKKVKGEKDFSSPLNPSPLTFPLAKPLRLAISHGEPLWSEPGTPTTLSEVLQRAAQKKQGNSIIYLQSPAGEIVQSYAALLSEAERILAGLRSLGLTPQDKVIFQLDLTRDIIPAFWGCILGGFIPVIMATPPTYRESNSALDKLCNVWKLLDKPLILTSDALSKSVRLLSQWLPFEDSLVASVEELRDNLPDTCHHHSQPDDVAFFNLTSGSTGMPKCIMLTHRNILSRARGTIQLCKQSGEDIVLSWLPFDHIASISDWHIRCVYLSCQIIYIAKEHFLGRPLTCLDLIDKYRVTHSGAPNFAYSLINEALKQETEHQWDLSCVKSLITAGESVADKVVEDCQKNLAKYGVKETAIQPAFGMAEFGSGITYFQPNSSNYPKYHTVDRYSLSGSVIYVSPEHPNSITFTSLGPVIPGVSIRIVDRDNTILPEDTVGRLQVKGEAVFPGYYQAPSVNVETLHATSLQEDGWFDTGDLGFLTKGHLVITGRAKETIIINGANYYNGEIEAVAEEVEGVEVSYTAALSVRDFGSDTEKLAIFFSSSGSDDNSLIELCKKIQKRVVRKVGVKPAYLIPVEREAIPKTPIGKIQRSQLSRRFEAGEFDAIFKRLDILRGNANTLPDWFYRKIWRTKQAVPLATQPTTGFFLVFRDRLGNGAFLCKELGKLNNPCVSVEIGSDFNKLADNRYCINPKDPSHYQLLLKSLHSEGIVIARVVHMWTYDEDAGEISSCEALDESQYQGVYSLLFLIQALAQNQSPDHPVWLYVISSHTQPTSPTDEIAPTRSPILGLIKTASQELPHLNCRHIDLTLDRVEVQATRILQELRVVEKEPEVAYRNGQRLVPRLEKVDWHQTQKQAIAFFEGGMYLVSGGLGGIGVEIAKYLLQHYKAKLLLVGRTALPERSAWSTHLEQSDAVSVRIKAYLSLEQLGGEIIYEAVDICDFCQLQQVVDRASSRWQCDLDGVIHLAGIAQSRLLVEETQSSLAATLRPKVLGTWVLSQLLLDRPNSVFISFSSVNSFFGGIAAGAYAAANSFLECFSHYLRASGSLRSYCFAWSMWDEVGMSRNAGVKDLIRDRGYQIVKAKQGLQSFKAGLHHDQAQLLVGLDGSKQPIRRFVETQSYQLQKLCAYFTAPTAPVSRASLQELSVRDRFGTLSKCDFIQTQEMPLLATGEIDLLQLVPTQSRDLRAVADLIAPKNELERQLTNIFQDVLGVEHLGINDNFFEMGGSSLLAIRLFTQIEKIFGVNLPLATLFQAATVEQLTNILRQEGWSAPWESLVAIQPSGDKLPFFCVDGLGGGLIHYYSLARHLAPTQPFYGLQALGMDGKQAPHSRVEDMAAHYIKEIRTVQQSGPYLLGGYSTGGIVAFEMAQQLHAQGQKVAMLAFLDTLSPTLLAKGTPPIPYKFYIHLLNISRLEPIEKLIYILDKVKRNSEKITNKTIDNFYLWSGRPLPKQVPEDYQFYMRTGRLLPEQVPKNYQLIKAVHSEAFWNYIPQAYPGRVTLFRAIERSSRVYYEAQLGWGDLAALGVELQEVPGDHDTMLISERCSRIIAEKLQASLDKVQAEALST